MRRPNGSGTIVKLSGNRRRPYAVRVSARDKYGQIVQTAIGYYATAKAAQEALDEHNRRKALGLTPAVDQMSMTVGQIYEAWSGRAYTKVGESTAAGYRASWAVRLSRFANVRMRDMTIDAWQSVIDAAAAQGLSRSSIDKDVVVIRGLYRYAMERDIVMKDLSAFLDIPTIAPKVPKGAFDDFQLARLDRMVGEGFPWADTVLILCYTGFRVSEFLTLTPFAYHADCGGYLMGGMKTRAGKDRIVPVHPKIAPLVRSRMEEHGDMIISRNGKAVTSGWYREKAFRPVVASMGIPEATPHWCRHTFASLLHRAGADPLTAKWLMGHSTENDITAHYTHETIEELVKELRKLA